MFAKDVGHSFIMSDYNSDINKVMLSNLIGSAIRGKDINESNVIGSEHSPNELRMSSVIGFFNKANHVQNSTIIGDFAKLDNVYNSTVMGSNAKVAATKKAIIMGSDVTVGDLEMPEVIKKVYDVAYEQAYKKHLEDYINRFGIQKNDDGEYSDWVKHQMDIFAIGDANFARDEYIKKQGAVVD
ncbi:hypothetical protein [Mannheimia pernigra]|uniref:hypothetical protein n=1 Tax=Mannheimia pernigra TaxID=111844 RepID=UPI001317B5F9|nr:hypothetical protein [Mannheimia pernigra]QHB16783.1 hypothetical protein GM695_01245 [Mannheimia pernigra]